jgi:dihydrofolate reductase
MSFGLRCSLICMGKLIYGFNVSVDGYIADAQGNIDWSEPSEELHQYWNDFERETAVSFYGRRLYELMSAYWHAQPGDVRMHYEVQTGKRDDPPTTEDA